MSFTVKEILSMEVAPALGCTEPSAVALGAAAAASLLENEAITHIDTRVNPNIYKNGIGVFIPGAGENRGIELAAALGGFVGDPKRGLEVLESVDEESMAKAKSFVAGNHVDLQILSEKKHIHIQTVVHSESGRSESIIEGLHDNIVMLKLNGKRITEHDLLSTNSRKQKDLAELETWLMKQSLGDILTLLDGMDEDDCEQVQKGIDVNMRLSQHGMTNNSGLGVGATLNRLVREGILKKDMVMAARILTSAAADARMSGAKLPAMSSAGSGNHGLTAILPLIAVRDYLALNNEKELLKAIALSHCITCFVKAHTGRLGASCGCSTAAGGGAAAGIAYLMGGNAGQIAGAIKNLISDLAGVICDGAKTGCALKLSTAAATAVQSALFSLRGISANETDGIVGSTSEQTMKNVGELSTQGMIQTDHTILEIMMRKQIWRQVKCDV